MHVILYSKTYLLSTYYVPVVCQGEQSRQSSRLCRVLNLAVLKCDRIQSYNDHLVA